jgi:hypothetical protein
VEGGGEGVKGTKVLAVRGGKLSLVTGLWREGLEW